MGFKQSKAIELSRQGKTTREISELLGIAIRTAQKYVKQGKADVQNLPEISRWDQQDKLSHQEFNDEVPVEDLIEQRRERFEKISDRKNARKIRPVEIKMDGPIAICHLGDPHLDDDGCNWPELLKTVEVVSSTKGMWAGNIGDTTNNWVGRLEKLWKHQSTTIDEAIRLAEWLFQSMPWLYMVLGNHDLWNQGAHLIHYLSQGSDIAVRSQGTARIELRFPKGDPVRIVARHDFKGRSIWNRAHGPLRASKLDAWGDIYISGHIHVWTHHAEEGMDGKPRHAVIVRGYKFFDKYAEEKGFYEHKHGESCTTIIDPLAHPMERVRIVWDVEEAAEMLKWLRKRAGCAV